MLSSRRVTGLSAEVIAELVAEVGPVWRARQDADWLGGRPHAHHLNMPQAGFNLHKH